jgi:uncharacterized membrane protein YgdD (TMEM256/DUF423 family)
MNSAKFWLTSGAILAGLGVALGAFGAHGLDRVLKDVYSSDDMRTIAGLTVPATWKYLQDFKTGAEYQLTHALALLVVGLLVRDGSRRTLALAGWSFLLGIVLFSGSLYLLAITGVKKWGAITPLGGLSFLVGWSSLAVAVWRSKRSDSLTRDSSATAS